MPVPRTRLHIVRPSELLHIGIEQSAFSANIRGVSRWWLAGDQIKEELVDPLRIMGDSAMAATPLRAVPTLEPWGEVRLIRARIWPDEMYWEATPTSIDIPVPIWLITKKLARDMSRQGTKAMRFFDPPALGLRPIFNRRISPGRPLL